MQAIARTGYLPIHTDGHADWESLVFVEDRPTLLLSPRYRWTRCVVRIDDHDRADGEKCFMTAKFKPKAEQVRMVMTDGPGAAMPEHKGKVFALIGPFESFTDKQDLQDALTTFLRGYNLARVD